MDKAKRTKYASKDFYRIKNIETGKYYLARYFIRLHQIGFTERQESTMKKCIYTYIVKGIAVDKKFHLELDDVGHFYSTRLGAEKILSELTQCSYNKRNTQAGRLLNSKFNFIGVKYQMRVKDI